MAGQRGRTRVKRRPPRLRGGQSWMVACLTGHRKQSGGFGARTRMKILRGVWNIPCHGEALTLEGKQEISQSLVAADHVFP